jgi:hypothetical protein
MNAFRNKGAAVSLDSRGLLERVLSAPDVALVVPRLSSEVLHRVVQRCGLEDCGELLALATPEQLAGVLDLDVWRADQPGQDEQFDADRFGVWIETLVESGAGAAADIVARLDVDLVTAALAHHARVFDPAAVSPSMGTDGLSCEVGGYLIVATRTDSWDAIVAVLTALDAGHHDCFQRVMRACRRLSNSRPEIDGLDNLLPDREQAAFDLAFHRENRREQLGYVTPAQARAFLRMSRELHLQQDTPPAGNPVARAYFRAIERTDVAETSGRSAPAAAAVGEVLAVLLEAGVLPQPPRALLEGSRGEAPRNARIERHMQFLREADHLAYSTRTQELAYLANAIVAGCSLQARPFTAQEASDAAVATCNLGLENWPHHWLPAASHLERPDDFDFGFLGGHDFVTVFQVGWTVLHEQVCMYAAEQLVGILADIRCDDHEIQAGLDVLRREMATQWKAGAPWGARDALDVITALDMPAWAALLGLIDECPVIHAGMAASRDPRTRAVSASAFEFVSENRQIASVHEFMRTLPDTLRS